VTRVIFDIILDSLSFEIPTKFLLNHKKYSKSTGTSSMWTSTSLFSNFTLYIVGLFVVRRSHYPVMKQEKFHPSSNGPDTPISLWNYFSPGIKLKAKNIERKHLHL